MESSSQVAEEMARRRSGDKVVSILLCKTDNIGSCLFTILLGRGFGHQCDLSAWPRLS